MKNSPCYNDGKGCSERVAMPNCHETCQRYKEWVEERAKCQIANATQKAYLGYYFDILRKSRKKGNHK